MVIETSWGNTTHTRIHVDVKDRWEAEDLHLSEVAVRKMLDDAAEPVNVVMSVPDGNPLPVNSFGEMRKFIEFQHPNRDQLVFVGPEEYIDALSEVMGRIFRGDMPTYVHFAYDMGEVQQLIGA